MVRALLDGRKTQTRRLLQGVSPAVHKVFSEWDIHDKQFFVLCAEQDDSGMNPIVGSAPSPYQTGDRLYVREAFGLNHYEYQIGRAPKVRPVELTDEYISYRATEDDCEISNELRYRPSIHMPRWASRMWLAVTDVRVQRLQDISEDDCIAEGIDAPAIAHFGSPIKAYAALWDHLHGGESNSGWAANPWIVAVTFDVKRGNIDARS